MKKIEVPKISLQEIKSWVTGLDRKVLVQIIIALGSFLIFILFFFTPILVYNKKVSRQADNLKAKVMRATVKISRIPEMKRQKELFGARIKTVREQFFDTNEAERLLEIISTLASETGVKISASRPVIRMLELPEPFSKMYASLSYELAVEGSYHNLGQFVNHLESYKKNLSISELQIVGAEKASGLLQGSVILTAFVQNTGQS